MSSDNGNTGGKILLIDDEPSILYSLNMLLSRERYACETAPSGEEGLVKFRANLYDYDLVITDLAMPGIDGMQVLKAVKDLRPETFVIILTAHGNTETAVRAMHDGAYYYLSKPFNNEELKILIAQAFARISLERENVTLRTQLREKYRFENIVGTSDRMADIFGMMTKVANTDVTVLVTGESGTGKELVARAIHFNSSRKLKNFVTLNCAAIPADLLENELFGHEKGAFTGAHSEQKGKFEIADGGTLFLDEIGDMPVQTQAKVLRALQEQVIERLGGNAPVKVNVRIIAATNKNLEEEIKKKNFREDLYYRLNVINVKLPPLRERPSDIPLLVRHFISSFSKKMSKREPVFTAGALALVKGYHWPGNVRQLQNTVERILVLSDAREITEATLREFADLRDICPTPQAAGPRSEAPTPAWPQESDARVPQCAGVYRLDDVESLSFHDAQRALNEMFERDYLLRALRRNSGNISKTATQIGIHRVQLHEKIKNLKIDVESLKEKM